MSWQSKNSCTRGKHFHQNIDYSRWLLRNTAYMNLGMPKSIRPHTGNSWHYRTHHIKQHESGRFNNCSPSGNVFSCKWHKRRESFRYKYHSQAGNICNTFCLRCSNSNPSCTGGNKKGSCRIYSLTRHLHISCIRLHLSKSTQIRTGSKLSCFCSGDIQ